MWTLVCPRDKGVLIGIKAKKQNKLETKDVFHFIIFITILFFSFKFFIEGIIIHIVRIIG